MSNSPISTFLILYHVDYYHISFFFYSHGYAPFFQAIQPQLNSLRTYLLQQSKSSVNHLPTTPGTAAGSGHPGSSSQHKKSSAASSSSTTSSAAAMLNASQAVVNSNISIGKDHTSSSTNSAIQPNMMASTSRKPSPATANVAANVGSVIHNGGEFSTPISGRTQYTVSQKSSVEGQGKWG